MTLPALRLKTKILLLLVTVLLVALTSYFGLAIDLFRKDKSAYIYETNALLVETLGMQIETVLSSLIKTAHQMTATFTQNFKTPLERQRAIDDVFMGDQDLVELSLYNLSDSKSLDPAPEVVLTKEDYLKVYQLDKSYFERIKKEFIIPLERILVERVVVVNSSLANGAPLLTLYLGLSSGKDVSISQVLVARIRKDRLIELLSKSQMYAIFLMDMLGNVLVHNQGEKDSDSAGFSKSDFVREVLTNEVQRGAREFQGTNSKTYIGGYAKLPLAKLALISYIDKDKAFLATKRLTEKSVQFGLLIFMMTLILSVLFSRQLTRSIGKLHQATQNIAKGDFNLMLNITSSDEIGLLAHAFDRMAKEIQRLLLEVQVKARMEKELETAKMVQENLFPPGEFTSQNFSLAGYYSPASECGGDWWGYLPFGDSLLVMIGDATGHGTPAALVTAAAQSCFTTLDQMRQQGAASSLSPSSIMRILNAAIHHSAKGKIKMTFFVAMLDLQTGKLNYSNASHDMPLVSKMDNGIGQPRTKAGLQVLDGDADAQLGFHPDSTYREYTYQLEAGDVIFWYTDGLTECRNKDDQEYGERRLSQNLIKLANKNSDEIRREVVSAVTSFWGDRSPDDDVTFIIARVSENANFYSPERDSSSPHAHAA